MHQGKRYPIRVGKNSCYQGKYFKGQVIEAKYHKSLDQFVIPSDTIIYFYYLSIISLLLPIYCFWYFIKPKK